MPSKLLSDFLPQILPHVPGCIDQLARDAVRNAAIIFCERSKAYRLELDPMQVEAGISDYEFDVPDDTVVHEVLRVVIDGTPIDPKSPAQLDIERPGWQTETGTPFAYYLKDFRRKLRLVLMPDASIADGLLIEAALKPSKTALKFEQGFFEEYFDDVAYGALANLLSMPGKEWTNTGKADQNLARFNAAIGKHNVDAAKGFANAPLRTVPYYDIG